MVTKRMETVAPGPISGGFGGGSGFKPMGKPGFRTPRMVDFLPPAKMAPPTPAGNVPAFRGTGGYANLSRMVPSGAPGGPARVPNTGLGPYGTPSTMGSFGANLARGIAAAARAALTGLPFMDDVPGDEDFWENWAGTWDEYWSKSGPADPDPANWTFPGYTYSCTAPYGCAPPQPDRWDFWTNQGLPVFGCVPAIYTCNNFGTGFTETELRALPLGNYSDVWVGNNRGPFSQSLQHGWLRDAPVLTKLEPDLKRSAVPGYSPAIMTRDAPLDAPEDIPVNESSPSPVPADGQLNKPITYTPGYEVPATSVDFTPKGPTGGKVGTPYKDKHLLVPDDDPKLVSWTLLRIVQGYHALTEVNDFFEALADAIPGKPCRLPGFARAKCVLEHWNEIDPAQAAKNLIANEIEDQVVGRAMRLLGSASGGQYGGPSTTQMTTFLKNMSNF